MVLAEKGTLDQAKDVFARVREVSAEVLGDVWINLAHVYLAQNKHNEVMPGHGTNQVSLSPAEVVVACMVVER